ncbi:chitodextrinase, partial [Pseudoalteromonas denitrificans]
MFKKLCVFFSLILLSSYSNAANVHQTSIEPNSKIISLSEQQHPKWEIKKTYHGGDIIIHQDEIYIASHWVRGVEPEKNPHNWDGWVWVKDKLIPVWQPHRPFIGGELVKYGVRFYLARYWTQNETPNSHTSWQAIDDLFYPTPDIPPVHPDENITLDGLDRNKNGIRDDYERKIYTQFNQPELIAFSISAAPIWQTVVDIHQNKVKNLDTDASIQLILDFMQITYCIRMLQQTYPSFRSPKLDFFNTFDRA